MNSDQHIWRLWATSIHRWGVQDWVAALLDAAGPFSLLGAQILYVGQPALKHIFPEGQIMALAEMLEDTICTREFVSMLREVASSESV
jgi:hypothetical protein